MRFSDGVTGDKGCTGENSVEQPRKQQPAALAEDPQFMEIHIRAPRRPSERWRNPLSPSAVCFPAGPSSTDISSVPSPRT